MLSKRFRVWTKRLTIPWALLESPPVVVCGSVTSKPTDCKKRRTAGSHQNAVCEGPLGVDWTLQGGRDADASYTGALLSSMGLEGQD